MPRVEQSSYDGFVQLGPGFFLPRKPGMGHRFRDLSVPQGRSSFACCVDAVSGVLHEFGVVVGDKSEQELFEGSLVAIVRHDPHAELRAVLSLSNEAVFGYLLGQIGHVGQFGLASLPDCIPASRGIAVGVDDHTEPLETAGLEFSGNRARFEDVRDSAAIVDAWHLAPDFGLWPRDSLRLNEFWDHPSFG